ncbi:MAG: glycosyltransferase family 1 protein [Bacteroidales bacterium]|nr:glycosyltransferase family 1 protein [Bacteroidales bacterium]
MSRQLHIVSFNVPWPADYGGVIDVYYRLRALAEAGVELHLHCFAYGRGQAPELERLCAEVNYYQRDMSPWRQLSARPFIVASRHSDDLRRRLAADGWPVLLEGIHCCGLLADGFFAPQRTVMVRTHNVEADYYALLSRSERNLGRRLYLATEAAKLRHFEPTIGHATAVLAITEADKRAFEAMGCHNVRLMSAAHPYNSVAKHEGLGNFALYHGNLAVAENYNAVARLADAVFADGITPFVVAGANPPHWLVAKLDAMPNVTLVANPSDEAMSRLLAEAQVCIMVTEQATGLKLKLLASLYEGRHCLVNRNMVAGTGLEALCCVAESDDQLRHELRRLMTTEFSAAEAERRATVLQPLATARAIEPLLSMI